MGKKGGRPRMDPVMMLKVLFLQKLYDLSDQAMEYQIADRMSFQRFLKIQNTKGIPDQKTIWLFREQVKEHGLIDELFDTFVQKLREKSLIVNSGKIVDASIVHAPMQRNTREENQKINEGSIPEEWKDQPNKVRQKDVDATWVKRHGKAHFGYKNHVKVDSKSKLIENYQVTVSSEHDSQALEDVLEESDREQKLYADSAYRSEEIETELKRRGIRSCIHEKGKRGAPLTKTQQKRNRLKSKTRARVEHVFGHIKKKMGGLKVRSIGWERAAVNIGLFNLAYNIDRANYLKKTLQKRYPI
jgi:IS5 family transposase